MSTGLKMKKWAPKAIFVAGSILLSQSTINLALAVEEAKPVYITIDSDALAFTENTFKSRMEEVSTYEGISVVKTDEESLPWLSMLMHKNFKRCGGFMLHDDEADALDLLQSQDGAQLLAKNNIFASYKIDQDAIVKPLISKVVAGNIQDSITKLSAFQNRFYKGESGKQSAAWIKDTWAALVKNRSDATVEYFQHPAWDQPSIILTIKGKSPEVIIVGGHQDSINGPMGAKARAPGADDNASGISTVTEVIRVLADGSYAPEKTLMFIAYAGEEVGLLGSKAIAQSFKQKGVNVIGVMQLDMTNFQGTQDLDIVMMTDYTNGEQNKFIGSLLDHYLPEIRWGYDKCGYGCSDHASWHAQGYPASMPFESKMGDYNSAIHTGKDTLDTLGNKTTHAAKFAKMALSYVVELDR